MSMNVYARLFFVGIMAIASMSSFAVSRTDVVVLVNGDAVTGEIQFLEFGNLNYDTDSMGSVDIDWEDVTSIVSDQYVEVEIASGERFYGSLESSPVVNTLSIGFGDDIDLIDKSRVIRITPIATNEMFIKRLEGTASFGFTSGKASDVTQGRMSADVRYRTTDYLVGAKVDSLVTSQKEAETTQRQTVSFNYQRFRNNRWFTEWVMSGEKNDELGINSRYLAGGGLGRYLTQTNRDQFSVVAGLVATRESFTGTESSTTNAEGKISIKYLHRSLVPESDVSFTADVFPLLDDLSTFRAESNLTIRREIVRDLFIDLSIYYSYLSDPTDGAEKDDYGVTTSVGYRF